MFSPSFGISARIEGHLDYFMPINQYMNTRPIFHQYHKIIPHQASGLMVSFLVWNGIGGRLAMESVAGMVENMQNFKQDVDRDDQKI